MIRRFFDRLICHQCISDPTPVREHPATESWQRLNDRLARMIVVLDAELSKPARIEKAVSGD